MPLLMEHQREIKELQDGLSVVRANFARVSDLHARIEGVAARQHDMRDVMQGYVGRLNLVEERVAGVRDALKEAVTEIKNSAAKDLAHVAKDVGRVADDIEGVRAILAKLVWIVVGSLVPMAIAGIVYSIVQVTPELKHAWDEGSPAPPAAAATLPGTSGP